MFTIQYEAMDGTHKMQELDSKSLHRLTAHLAGYTRPIYAVYEQSTPITKTLQKRLLEWPGSKTRHAVAFMNASATVRA